MVAETLGAVGTVDVCVVNTWRPPDLELDWPEWVGDAEWCRVEQPPGWPATMLLGRDAPVRYSLVPPDALRAARARFFSNRYDLTWCAEAHAYEPVAAFLSPPVVFDLHNVFSAVLEHKRRLLLRRPWLAASWRDGLDDAEYVPGIERRWREWEATAVARCDRVVVCSELDRDRLGGRAVVVPNCYPRPAEPAGRARDGSAPLRIGFVGLLDYQANLDGVLWFAREVLPRIRALEPRAEFESIGRATGKVARRLRRHGVTLPGFVPELERQLADVSVLVAPLRFGGGTRFKVLEAFAHEIPIVATTIGVEGIPARDGEHLLIRDDAQAFARAVVALHRDPALRARVVGAAARLYEQRYTWEHGVAAVEREVESLTRSAAGAAAAT
jgi:glycosyltransferase involved in cell wall biosynthesis